MVPTRFEVTDLKEILRKKEKTKGEVENNHSQVENVSTFTFSKIK